jgi:Asp-tRNA(Asn)/Glu-tRNA(Gln) amidotransferase A subunit family amidase
LPYPYHTNFTDADKKIIDQPIEELVRDIQESKTSPLSVLRTYGKVAVKAQERTNCITELLLPEAESWLESDINLKGPLAGIPVSLKDSVQVKGFDTTLGYSALANQPFQEDGPMTRLLKDAGMLTRLRQDIQF